MKFNYVLSRTTVKYFHTLWVSNSRKCSTIASAQITNSGIFDPILPCQRQEAGNLDFSQYTQSQGVKVREKNSEAFIFLRGFKLNGHRSKSKE
jgi:hypothetical protein